MVEAAATVDGPLPDNRPTPPLPTGRPPVRSRHRRSDRRVLLAGLAASVLLHVVFVLVSRFIVVSGVDETAGVPFASPVYAPAGTEVVVIRAVADADEAAMPPVPPAAAVREPATIDPRPIAPADAPGPRAAEQTPPRGRFEEAIEALRPRLLDPRLQPGNADALRTDDERAALRAYARINALNDSILAAMERGRRATDWTFTDAEGRRWGVSPGKLHLGGLELPLPLTFSPTPEQRERIREWSEIQAQAERGAIGETFDERVEAIREARDADRESP